MTMQSTGGIERLSDGELMAQIQAGSTSAFGQLYDRYCDRAYRLAASICRDRARAEDAVQTAFLAIWRSRDSYHENRGNVAAWLMAVVHNRAVDAARTHAQRTTRLTSVDVLDRLPAADNVAVLVEARTEARRVRDLLALLPQPQQEVIMLAFYGGLTHRAIAAHLNLPSGTIKGRMRLGLDKLRTHLEDTAA